jgi:Cysteine rich repeat
MITPKAVAAAALFISVLTSSASLAQSPVVAQWKVYVLESCKKEVDRHCKKVVAGDGRLLACLYAREKSLSTGCKTAVSAALERLNRSYTALHEAQRICEPDAKRLCTGMVTGGGNVVDCLAKARARVSRSCNAVLDEALMRP